MKLRLDYSPQAAVESADGIVAVEAGPFQLRQKDAVGTRRQEMARKKGVDSASASVHVPFLLQTLVSCPPLHGNNSNKKGYRVPIFPMKIILLNPVSL